MAHGDTQRIEAEISSIFENAGNSQEEVQASLARYACVLASSYLEAAFRELLALFTRARSNEQVLRYVDGTLGSFRNPNMENILQLVGRFDSQYRQSLEVEVEGRLKDSVNSISLNRNYIAHGRRSSISLARIRSYYNDARTVVSRARTIMQV